MQNTRASQFGILLVAILLGTALLVIVPPSRGVAISVLLAVGALALLIGVSGRQPRAASAAAAPPALAIPCVVPLLPTCAETVRLQLSLARSELAQVEALFMEAIGRLGSSFQAINGKRATSKPSRSHW
jgi:hypothetical protein